MTDELRTALKEWRAAKEAFRISEELTQNAYKVMRDAEANLSKLLSKELDQ